MRARAFDVPQMLPDDEVRARRTELSLLPRGELIERYAALPGRDRQARRTRLSTAVIIDVLIWVEAGGSRSVGGRAPRDEGEA